MNIIQKGDSIWGTSKIEINKSNDFAVIELTGNYTRFFFTFQESKIKEQNIQKSAYWCIKNGSLKYNSTDDKLEGTWYSTGGCGPGKIILQRFQTKEIFDEIQQENDEMIDTSVAQIPEIDTIPEVKIVDNKIVVNKIYFTPGSSNLSEIAKKELDKIFKFLYINKKLNIFISGHTDNIGDEERLQELSEQRVAAVKKYLIEKGIDESRITGKGFGSSQPLTTGETDAEHAKNRRIEFEIIY